MCDYLSEKKTTKNIAVVISLKSTARACVKGVFTVGIPVYFPQISVFSWGHQ